MNTQELLEQLTDAYARRDLLNIDKEQARDDAIPEEVEAALADIDLRFSPKLEILDNLIGRLEAQAKEAVLSEGKTVNGGSLQAVFTKGRVSWDSKKLDGMMIIIPELSQARKQGDPSVSIRKVG